MRNIKITVEYDGTRYFGWQVQEGSRKTVQSVLEEALRKILSEKVKVIGSGRTDAGVHALAQAANFSTNSKIEIGRIAHALNALLPDDISVTKAAEAAPDFHAVRCAKSKVYRYTILNRAHRCALLEGKAHFCHFPLDVSRMRSQARCLVGKHDFKAFCASSASEKNTVRTIKRLAIKRSRKDGLPLITVEIEADGFLYNMVRNIVGTLIDIGRGKLRKSLKSILDSKDRKAAGARAPACGLCLIRVKY